MTGSKNIYYSSSWTGIVTPEEVCHKNFMTFFSGLEEETTNLGNAKEITENIIRETLKYIFDQTPMPGFRTEIFDLKITPISPTREINIKFKFPHLKENRDDCQRYKP